MKSEFFICTLNDISSFWPDPNISKRREVYTVLLTGEEECNIILNNKSVRIQPHTILFVSPDCLFAVDEKSIDIDLLSFTNVFYSRNHHDAEFLQNSTVFPDAGYHIYSVPPFFLNYVNYVVRLLYEAMSHMNNKYWDYLTHNLVEQILLLCSLYGSEEKSIDLVDSADHMIVVKFKSLLPTYVRTSRSVTFYADKLNLTSRRLTKAVQQVLDKNPKDVLTEYIVKDLKWRLLYTDQSIKTISWEYGFLDENNFSAFFLKEVGETPSAYRKRNRS